MAKFYQRLTIFIISSPLVIALVGAVVYVSYGLNQTGAYLTLILSLIIIIWLIKYYPLNNKDYNLKQTLKNLPLNQWLTFTAFIFFWLFSAWLLWTHQTDRAIITPWQIIPHWYLVTYGLGIMCLLILSRSSSKLLTLGLIMQSGLLLGVASLVYKLGFGFDPFVHEAATKAIENLGQIKPLTPYYLGQYSLIIVLKTITGISTMWWSKILVPGMAMIFLPWLILRWLKHHHDQTKNWGLAAILMLSLPVTIFIVTTPQSLAYLFLLIVILWPTPQINKGDKVIVWLAALAALVTQPLAGIPAILLALTDLTKNTKLDRLIYSFIIFLMTITLPLAFYIFTALDNNTGISLTTPNLKFLNDLRPISPLTKNWWLNFTYLYQGLWGLIILSLTTWGAYLSFKKHNLELKRRFTYPAIALIISALITTLINFHFLIDYEKSDYPLRIIITAVLVALPLILGSFKEIALIIEQAPSYLTKQFFIIITLSAVAVLYLSYPRFDHYHNSHSYATSKADILAVRWIEQASQGEPYIVLANQQVSAAALREFGFKNYYKNNIFYYPIPTGGPLYQTFLSLVENPSLEIINQARDISGVDKVYVVLNSYWWDYNKLVPATSTLADSIQDIGDGQITIFVFSKK